MAGAALGGTIAGVLPRLSPGSPGDAAVVSHGRRRAWGLSIAGVLPRLSPGTPGDAAAVSRSRGGTSGLL